MRRNRADRGKSEVTFGPERSVMIAMSYRLMCTSQLTSGSPLTGLVVLHSGCAGRVLRTVARAEWLSPNLAA